MKTLRFATLGVAATLALSACSGSSAGSDAGSEPGNDPSTGGEAPAEMRLWLVGTDTPHEARDHLEEEFETAYPETDLVIEEKVWEGLVDKLTTSLSAATARTSSRWTTPRRWPSPS